MPASQMDSNIGAATPPQLSINGHVATITLNRPAQRNRLDDQDLHTLLEQLAQVEADPVIRVLVLTANTQGQPRPVFCAGYDLAGFDRPGAGGQALFERVAEALARARPITICGLNGSVYGGATDLLLACDLALGLDGCEFRMPALALGLHYYPGGLQRYVSRLGLPLAKRAFLTARALPLELLQQVGCLEALVTIDEFGPALAQLSSDVSALAPLAAQMCKQSLNELGRGAFDLAQLRQRETLAAGSADFAEGRRAYSERRQPEFTGR